MGSEILQKELMTFRSGMNKENIIKGETEWQKLLKLKICKCNCFCNDSTNEFSVLCIYYANAKIQENH